MATNKKLFDPITIAGCIAGVLLFIYCLYSYGWTKITIILGAIICLMVILVSAVFLIEKNTKVEKKTDTREILTNLLVSSAKNRIKEEAKKSRLSGNIERAVKLESIMAKLAIENGSDKDYYLAYEEFKEKEDRDIVLKVEEMIMNGSTAENILSVIANECPGSTKTRVLKKAFNEVFADITNSSEINLDKERIINSLRMQSGLSVEEFQSLSNYSDYVKTLQVQDILQGHTPDRFTSKGIPINLQKNEKPIWAFNNTDYYEEKVKRSHVGVTSGLSIRLAKGVYYRVGAFRGETVEKSNLKYLYTGTMVLTDKNIYFYSREKSMRLPYSKIVSYIPFEDSIGIQLDRINTKPVYIKNIDGRFAYNIVSNINNLS